MLKIVIRPYTPVTCTAVMSLVPGMLTVFQVLVFILELIQMTDRSGVLSVAREVGDTRW